MYKNELSKHKILLYKKGEDFIKNINIGHVMVMIESLWKQITTKPIKNYWVKSTLADLAFIKKEENDENLKCLIDEHLQDADTLELEKETIMICEKIGIFPKVLDVEVYEGNEVTTSFKSL